MVAAHTISEGLALTDLRTAKCGREAKGGGNV
jgi:hypothetical protein